jgi:probable HAF family extracellular repeat protein
MSQWSFRRGPTLAIAIILGAVSGNALGASFMPLGQLPGAEVLGENLAFRSSAQAVSADGGVVVGFAATGDGAELPFRWTAASGMVALEPFPAGTVFSIAHGVSADGSVVVGRSASGTAFQAFRWTTVGGSAGLGSLPSNRTPFSEAYAVSSDGNVVVGRSSSGNGAEAFRWTPDGGLVGLGVLPGIIADSSAFGVSGRHCRGRRKLRQCRHRGGPLDCRWWHGRAGPLAGRFFQFCAGRVRRRQCHCGGEQRPVGETGLSLDHVRRDGRAR